MELVIVTEKPAIILSVELLTRLLGVCRTGFTVVQVYVSSYTPYSKQFIARSPASLPCSFRILEVLLPNRTYSRTRPVKSRNSVGEQDESSEINLY